MRKILVVTSLAILCCLACTAQNSPASPKRLRMDLHRPQDAVRVVRLMYGETDVTARGDYRTVDGMPFDAPDDWLKSVTIVLKNMSGKVIIAGSLILTFPETGKGTPDSPQAAFPVPFGREPEHAQYDRYGRKRDPGNGEPLTWKPDEEFSVSLAPFYYDIVNTFQHNPAAKADAPGKPTTAYVLLQFFYFTDGTKWAPGVFAKPGDAPGQWVKITADEFNSSSAH